MNWSKQTSTMTQTLFAQLEQTAIDSELTHSIEGLAGNFSKRVSNGKTYWYYRYTDPGQPETQIYLGPDSQTIRDLAERKANLRVKADQRHIRKLVQSCVASGCHFMVPHHFKLVKQLAQYGFFYAGGILVGSHAFTAYANMLGVKWSSEQMFHTMDVDFSHAGNNISVALPTNLQINTTNAIESLKEGFLPRMSGQGRAGSWVHPEDKDYVIDFLTPQTSDNGEAFEHEQLGIALQPLRFMEYSLIDVQQTVVFDRNEVVVVNIPNPARYALHKLIVFNERKKDFVKAQKDLRQSAALIDVLKINRPLDLIDAWKDLQKRGPGWKRRAAIALAAMESQFGMESFADWVSNFESKSEETTSPMWRK